MKPRVRSTQLVAASFMISAKATVMMTKRWPRTRRITQPSANAVSPVRMAAAGSPIHIDHFRRRKSSAEV